MAGAEKVSLQPVAPDDFEALAQIRVAAMRESLERVGRYDAGRARERLRQNFAAEHTQWILLAGERVGFCALRPAADGFHLDHLYVLPEFQGRGLGSAVMRRLLKEADRQNQPVHVGALKESGSNRFYLRHGFVKTSEGEWDNYYVRATPGPVDSPAVSIREIQADDWVQFRTVRLQALQESPQAFGATYAVTDEQWQGRARFYQEDAGTCFILGFENGMPVAMAGAYRDKNKSGVAHLYSVWTAPDWRGKGVTQQLIEPLLRWARESNLPIMEAWVTAHNERALGFYRKAGFVLTDETCALRWDATVRQVLIRKQL